MCETIRIRYKLVGETEVTADVVGYFESSTDNYIYEFTIYSTLLDSNLSFQLFNNHDVGFYWILSGTGDPQAFLLYDNQCPFGLYDLNTNTSQLFEYFRVLPPEVHTNILASGVSNVEHIAAFDAMVEQRFANLDVEAVLIYLIDTVDVDALPSLASQFDVLGYKGYGLAQTEQQKREVIKRAIELHRYKGTPWSIKEALRAIGYYDATIQERLINPIYYNGTYNHNGSQFYGPGHWADFRVKIDIGNDMGVTAQSASDAVKLILEYKNVRSRLRDVSYMANLTEYVTGIEEELTVNIDAGISDALGYYYDNTYIYGGQITHGTVNETLTT